MTDRQLAIFLHLYRDSFEVIAKLVTAQELDSALEMIAALNGQLDKAIRSLESP